MPTTRLPLTQPIETRDGTLSKDSKSVNGYFETREGTREFIKRPGLLPISLGTALPVAQCQGLVFFNTYFIVIINNTVYKVSTSSYAVTSLGTISGTVKTCYFAPSSNNQYLFFHNQTYGYLIDGTTWSLTKYTNDNVVSTNILVGGSGYVSGDAVVFSAPGGSGTTATGTLILSGTAIVGITITSGGSGYSSPPSVSVTTSTGVGFSATCLLNAFPSGPLCPGAVYLDSYIIVGTVAGRIYNSDVGNPKIWDALSYLTAESEPDNLVGISKHLNYVIGYGQYSTEFFYDIGNATASPLAVASPYKLEIGAANGDSIVQFDQTVIFLGTSVTTGPVIYLLDGTSPTRISNGYIDRILQQSNLNQIRAFAFKTNGHTFYVLTLHESNITLVYDLSEKMWNQWTQWAPDSTTGVYGEQYFRPSFAAGYNLKTFVIDDDNGLFYELTPQSYSDGTVPIYYRTVTDIMDSGSTKRKFYERLEIIGDKIPGNMKVRHTGDDYKTWSTYRSVDLNKARPQIYILGADRRRAWEFLCTDAVPLRLNSAEIDFKIGEIENEGLQPAQYRK